MLLVLQMCGYNWLLCNMVAFSLTIHTQVSMSTCHHMSHMSYYVRCSVSFRKCIKLKISNMPRIHLLSVIKLTYIISFSEAFTWLKLPKLNQRAFLIFLNIWNTDVRNTFSYFFLKRDHYKQLWFCCAFQCNYLCIPMG